MVLNTLVHADVCALLIIALQVNTMHCRMVLELTADVEMMCSEAVWMAAGCGTTAFDKTLVMIYVQINADVCAFICSKV